MPNKDIIQITKADEIARKVHLLYLTAIRNILKNTSNLKINPNVVFQIKDYPKLQRKINRQLNILTANSVRIINNATEAQWLEAWTKNQGIASSYLKRGLLTEAQQLAYTNKNLQALATFQNRKINGFKLSNRIWKFNRQFKGEIEMGIDVALKEGMSASTLSRKIRANLQNPNNLFRRIRNKHGNLHLSKMAKRYSPGAGAYRSSYKNAMRMARTEINMAYRTSDNVKYQQFDFVLGFEVKRSRRYFGCDICKELEGKYPKDFTFVGWHPQCRCYTVPILNKTDDFIKQQKAILRGETFKPTGQITALPKKFSNWFNANKQKVRNLKTEPFFIRDNKRLILNVKK